MIVSNSRQQGPSAKSDQSEAVSTSQHQNEWMDQMDRMNRIDMMDRMDHINQMDHFDKMN